MIFSKKRPFNFNSGFNSQQNLLILGLVTVFTNQKILEAEFSTFIQYFAAFQLQKWANSKKINILNFRESKFQKWKIKSKLGLL